MGCLSWVVDPDDHNRLVPFGDVGELMVEGPIVGRGYLCEESENSPFISMPSWLQGLRAESPPLFKTGDLVRYATDGSVHYVGRKDSLVKIRGQRLHPEEVEFHIYRCAPALRKVCVGVFQAPSEDLVLMAFVAQDLAGSGPTQLALQPPSGSFAALAVDIQSQLAAALPPYMIPSFIVPVTDIPLTPNGKVDRRALTGLMVDLSVPRLAQYHRGDLGALLSTDRKKGPPIQDILRDLWAEALGQDPKNIGGDDDFLHSGGNSMRAMQLVSLARKHGIHLTVEEIFRARSLGAIAAGVKSVSDPSDTHDHHCYSPFSLLGDGTKQREALSLAASRCGVEPEDVEDIYPCTPLQEGVMALSIQRPGAYVSQHVFDIRVGVELRRVREAWRATVQANPVLRTRMVSADGGTLQVVLRRDLDIDTADDLEQYLLDNRAQPMGLGEPLIRFGLVASAHFVLTLHHTIYDGVSLPLILSHFENQYYGCAVEPPPFTCFIAHIRELEVQGQCREFWQSYLSNCNAPVFPELPSAGFVPNANNCIQHRVLGIYQSDGITTSNAIRLALAVLISHYTNSEDVIFGVTVNGRGAAVPDIQQMTGPTFSTLPLRVRVNPDQDVRSALDRMQMQATEMIPFEQAGLAYIRHLSEDAAAACQFQTHLVVQPSSPLDVPCKVLAPQPGRCLDTGDNNALFAFNALLVVCTLDERHHAVDVAINYDPRVMSEVQARRFVQQFGHLLQQLQRPVALSTLAQLQCVSPEDLSDIRRWNRILPTSCDRCLHDMVLEKCASQPDAVAVAAWDGELTYRELDRLSAGFASRLQELHVRPQSMVPFCLDRSKWAVVAILAVLRAGGTCVLTDPSQPRARVQGIIRETGAKLALVSPGHVAILDGLCCAGLAISAAAFADLPEHPVALKSLPIVSPADPAFIVFTSGSTGKPKGIIVEHRNLATCARDQYGPMGYAPRCRVLHFASYTFDLSIYETVITLVFGGCVCVPSEEQRLADLAGCMRQYRVNWTCLTPSSLRLFRPEDVPCLETFCVGGESLTQAHVDTWASHVRFINSYGPAETCFCTAGVVDPHQWKPGDVGNMFGGLAWVTVINNPDCLAPVGAVGELIVEGPTVARGYLNNDELTRAGFIQAPPWLQGWRTSGRTDRLYRTGDLVQYGDDGIIRFIGRRDTQVKLRGQRVELTEVEYHLQRCFPGAQQAVAEVIIPESPPDARATLVSFVFTHEDDGQTSRQGTTYLAEPTDAFCKTAHRALAQLRDCLPSYMVPSVVFPLISIPLTGTGKINRRALRQEAAVLTLTGINAYVGLTNGHHSVQSPRTPTERALHAICAQVLNLNPSAVGRDDDFFCLGGDSISAMQVAAKAKAAGLAITVRDITAHKTIAAIAATGCSESPQPLANGTSAVVDDDDDDLIPFGPSPIQQLFFDTIHENYNYFNQSFSLRLTRPVDVETLDVALHAVIAHHAMLRARFQQHDDGSWTQRVQSNATGSYHLQTHFLASIADVAPVISHSQQSLNIFHGPLLRVDLITTNAGQQYLFLVAHHLVMDLVSWRIILADMEDALRNGGALSASTPPSLSFPAWCRLQAEYGREVLTPEKAFPVDALPSVSGFWGEDVLHRNTWGDIATISFTLDPETSALLYQDKSKRGPVSLAEGARHITPYERYHAALLASFVRTFPSRSPPAIHCEGHGRETAWYTDSSLDLSRTVGWFTTLWPCPVACTADSPLHVVIDAVHTAHSTMPFHGWGYFTSRYTNAAGRRAFGALSEPSSSVPEIVLNYTGLYQQLEREGALFQTTDELDGAGSDIIKSAPRFGLIEVSVAVRHGCVVFDVGINKHMERQGDIRKWLESCRRLLVEMARL